jgi:hypothetical protein
MRALFNYNPEEDTLLPCAEIGLAFHQGDVLEIVDQSDPNWWQARIVGIGGVGGPKGPAGLIPSQVCWCSLFIYSSVHCVLHGLQVQIFSFRPIFAC